MPHLERPWSCIAIVLDAASPWSAGDEVLAICSPQLAGATGAGDGEIADDVLG